MRSLRQVVVALGLLAPTGDLRADIQLAAPPAWARTVNALLDGWKAAGGGEIDVTYGNSDDQSIEIEAGAHPVDVIILGDPHALYRLVGKGLTLPALSLASSPIVLAASTRDPGASIPLDDGFPALLGKAKLAIYDPDSDGIGIATRDLLAGLGLWERLTDRMSTMASANAMIQAVEGGGARFAILLRADLTRAKALHEVANLSAGENGQDYIYLAAAVKSRYRPEVAQFLGFLHSSAAAAMVTDRGFSPENGH